MPPPAYSHLNQTALMWPWLRIDRYNEVIVGPPQELEVRWENVQRQMNNPQGQPISVDATVVAYEEIELGSIMWEGGFDDAPGTGSGTGTSFRTEGGYMEVVAYETMYDLRGVVLSRRYGLAFYRTKELNVVAN